MKYCLDEPMKKMILSSSAGVDFWFESQPANLAKLRAIVHCQNGANE